MSRDKKAVDDFIDGLLAVYDVIALRHSKWLGGSNEFVAVS